MSRCWRSQLKGSTARSVGGMLAEAAIDKGQLIERVGKVTAGAGAGGSRCGAGAVRGEGQLVHCHRNQCHRNHRKLRRNPGRGDCQDKLAIDSRHASSSNATTRCEYVTGRN